MNQALSILLLYSYAIYFTLAYYGDPANGGVDLTSVFRGALVNIKDNLYYLGGNIMVGERMITSDHVIVYNFTSDGTLQEHISYHNNSPNCFICKGYLLPDNKTIAITGENYQETDTRYLLRLRFFNTSDMTWLPIDPSIDNNLFPISRNYYTSAISPERDAIYLIGGEHNYTDLFSGIIRYDLVNQSSIVNLATEHPSLNISLIGASAEMLPNGIVVIAFGFHEDLIPNKPNEVFLFDTNTNTITTQSIEGVAPNPKIFVSSTLGPDKTTIYYYGGQEVKMLTNKFDGVSYSDLSILDTTTWSWISSEVAGVAPGPAYLTNMAVFNQSRIFISTGLIDGNKASSVAILKNVPGPGEDIKSSSLQWFTNYDPFDNPILSIDSKFSRGNIAVLTIGFLLLLVVIFFVVRMFSIKLKLIMLFLHKNLIWGPRFGEPMWAETFRLIIRSACFVFVLLFIVYTVYKSINSPIITQRSYIYSSSIRIPDARFCFSGFSREPGTPFVLCSLTNGTRCKDNIITLNRALHIPDFDDGFGNVTCSMFRSGPDFYITKNSFGYVNSVNTKIIFSFYAEPLYNDDINNGVIYIDFYPPDYNPNHKIYKLTDDTKISENIYEQWKNEEKFSSSVDSIILRQGVSTTASYTYTTVKKLKANNGWNLIGFSPNYEEYMTAQTFFRDIPSNRGGIPPEGQFNTSYISQLSIRPYNFESIIETEERVFSLLNAFAQIGGVLGLLVSIQAILFGFRPQSPWGLIHKWSFGSLNRRLTDKLADYFNRTGGPVPLFDPVSDRLNSIDEGYSGSSSNAYLRQESINLNRIENGGNDEDDENKNSKYSTEERLQFLEHVLKSYYLDDEIFRSLKYTAERNRLEAQSSKDVEDKKNLSVTQNEAVKDNNDSDNSSENSASSSSLMQVKKSSSLDGFNSNTRLLSPDKEN